VPLLAQLGIRRRAKLATEDYQVFARDLETFELCDVEEGLDALVELSPGDFEGSFPGSGRLVRAVRTARAKRLQSEENAWKPCGECSDCHHPGNIVLSHGLIHTVDGNGNRFVRRERTKCYQEWKLADGRSCHG
jgi:hypothetical protein